MGRVAVVGVGRAEWRGEGRFSSQPWTLALLVGVPSVAVDQVHRVI